MSWTQGRTLVRVALVAVLYIATGKNLYAFQKGKDAK